MIGHYTTGLHSVGYPRVVNHVTSATAKGGWVLDIAWLFEFVHHVVDKRLDAIVGEIAAEFRV